MKTVKMICALIAAVLLCGCQTSAGKQSGGIFGSDRGDGDRRRRAGRGAYGQGLFLACGG